MMRFCPEISIFILKRERLKKFWRILAFSHMTRNLNPFDGYDEDLALRLAIERSLAQEILQEDSLPSQIANVLDIIKQTKAKINELIEYDVNPVSCDAKDKMNNRTNDTTNNNTLCEMAQPTVEWCLPWAGGPEKAG